jgi:hypothetical protein
LAFLIDWIPACAGMTVLDKSGKVIRCFERAGWSVSGSCCFRWTPAFAGTQAKRAILLLFISGAFERQTGEE